MSADNVLRIAQPDLLDVRTNLTAAVAASGTTLTVQNTEGFINTNPLLLEGYGIENAEIVKVNGAVSAGTSLTVTGTVFSHAIDCPAYKILFNQVQILGSATTSSADAVAIETVDLRPSDLYTDYVVVGTTYTYYFVRFYNSFASSPYYGDYSDAIPATGFTPKTVGFIRRVSFKNVGEDFGGRWTPEWVYDQVYLGEQDVAKELKRWSWLYSYDSDLGNITTGQRRIALPTDIEDSRTTKSILGMRIENFENMDPIDWVEYQDQMQGVAYTSLASTASIAATTLVLTDSRDFADSGAVNILGTTYSYTANNRATGTLSGLTALAAQIDSGSEVWQNVTFGTPTAYAINNGYAYFDTPPSSDYSGRNVWLDYYTTITKKNSDMDELQVNDPSIIVSWLEMAIKKEKNNGALAITDISYIEYSRKKKLLISNEVTGTKLSMVPQVCLPKRPIKW